MRLPSWWDTPFLAELCLLAAAAPLLYFPDRFPPAALPIGFALLAATWLWRRFHLGIWYVSTPAAWPIFFLFFIMLPVAVWAAPEPLRAQYTWPKVYVLCWNFCLFWTILSHSVTRPRLLPVAIGGLIGIGMLIAAIAPLGINWLFKLRFTEQLLSQLPNNFSILSREGEQGFHPNTIAGSLLFVFPLAASLLLAQFSQKETVNRWNRLTAILLLCTFTMGIMLLLAQSRSGYIGMIAGVLFITLMDKRTGRYVLLLISIAFVGLVTAFPSRTIEVLADIPVADVVGGAGTLTSFRVNLWQQALIMIHDFPLTGSGLGVFQEIGPLFYSVPVYSNYHLGHAHNFWLQTGVDFGIPGLIAVLILYFLAIFHVFKNSQRAERLWQNLNSRAATGPAAPSFHRHYPIVTKARKLVHGLIGCLVAQSIFSLTDSISMGGTPNMLLWYLFALIFSLDSYLRDTQNSVAPVKNAAPD